ncbi:hypothetical protein [Synechococcus phage S-H38]|uniref:Uncharacterized protein n=1 Tax=Synechococcus phage S-H38 TaxID=2783673 RepID=A0A873WIU5_9CAUD|nr:hypothetical protein PQC14_gp136 [Synechococcus phage S-H38]QPB07925.1 hypothetical protein [Synechococcus phage S-H38]
MNIFVVDEHPGRAAKVLPDKHIVKMPLECCQMLSIIYSKWYYNWGTLPKADGTPYATAKGAFRNHPCTIWAAQNHFNTAWLIVHGIALSSEYKYRYGKIHSCNNTLFEAKKIFHRKSKKAITCYSMAEDYARAMPDEFKLDRTISTIEAYKMYVASKPWVKDNYLRKPERKPEWLG